MSSIFLVFSSKVCSRLDVSLVTGTSDMIYSVTVKVLLLYTWFERPISYHWSHVLIVKCLSFHNNQISHEIQTINRPTNMTATIIMTNDTAYKIPAKPIFELKIWADSLNVPLRRRGSSTIMRQIRNLVKLSPKQQLDICSNQVKLSTFIYKN